MKKSTLRWVMDRWAHYIPFFRWIHKYDWKSHLLPDLVAAFTVAAVAAPEAVSFAGLANLPGASGLYTGFLGPLAYAFTGTSPHVLTGATSIMCIFTGDAIPSTWGNEVVAMEATSSNMHEPEAARRIALAPLLAMAVCLIQLFMSVCKLDGLVDYVSSPVMAGFTTGAALVTASAQVTHMLGLPKCKTEEGDSCSFLRVALFSIDHLDKIKWKVFFASCFCLFFLIGYKILFSSKVLPKFVRRLNSFGPLSLVLVTVPIVHFFNETLESWGLPGPEYIPPGFPKFDLPFGFMPNSPLSKGTLSDYLALVMAATPLALVGFITSLAVAKACSAQAYNYLIHPKQELLANSAANFFCAIGGGLPTTSSFSRSAIALSSRAPSPLSGLIASISMAIMLVTITKILSLIPAVARSAIVLMAVVKMVHLRQFIHLWKIDTLDSLVFLGTLLSVCGISVTAGIGIGILLQWFVALVRPVSPTERQTISLFAWVNPPTSRGMISSVSTTVPVVAIPSRVWDDITDCFVEDSVQPIPEGLPSVPNSDFMNPFLLKVGAYFSVSHDLQFTSVHRLSTLITELLELVNSRVPASSGDDSITDDHEKIFKDSDQEPLLGPLLIDTDPSASPAMSPITIANGEHFATTRTALSAIFLHTPLSCAVDTTGVSQILSIAQETLGSGCPIILETNNPHTKSLFQQLSKNVKVPSFANAAFAAIGERYPRNVIIAGPVILCTAGIGHSVLQHLTSPTCPSIVPDVEAMSGKKTFVLEVPHSALELQVLLTRRSRGIANSSPYCGSSLLLLEAEIDAEIDRSQSNRAVPILSTILRGFKNTGAFVLDVAVRWQESKRRNDPTVPLFQKARSE